MESRGESPIALDKSQLPSGATARRQAERLIDMVQERPDRVAIFIDGANMFYAQRILGWHLDFARVIDYFTRDAELYNAFYYTGVQVPPDLSQRDFLTALRHLGFTVREKVIKETFDQASSSTIRRANLDIEIVIDMFNTATRYDVAVLMSGDGDFERAVELLRSKGKEIIGVGTRGMIAAELENACDRYVKLEDIRSEVEKIRPPRDTSPITPAPVPPVRDPASTPSS
jgi:uncharacterized LabA/DUF88 family protein